MNKSKDNLEFQIKKQIEEREMMPSRDLWSEIKIQTETNHHSKSKINWFLVAACLVLAFGLGAALFFIKEEKPAIQQPRIVKDIQESPVEKTIVEPTHADSPLAVQNKENEKEKNISSQNYKEKPGIPSIAEKKLKPKENILQQNISIQAPDIKSIAKADSAKIPVKKKKYVDPSTLLFSVEHKDVIEKTKDGSNVATIELNRK